MPTRFALKITWRDGGEEYLADPKDPRRPVVGFATPEEARARREVLLRKASADLSAVDVVPFPKTRSPKGGA